MGANAVSRCNLHDYKLKLPNVKTPDKSKQIQISKTGRQIQNLYKTAAKSHCQTPRLHPFRTVFQSSARQARSKSTVYARHIQRLKNHNSPGAKPSDVSGGVPDRRLAEMSWSLPKAEMQNIPSNWGFPWELGGGGGLVVGANWA